MFKDDWREAGDSVTETAKAILDLLKKITPPGFCRRSSIVCSVA